MKPPKPIMNSISSIFGNPIMLAAPVVLEGDGELVDPVAPESFADVPRFSTYTASTPVLF